jgi:hypothetical protein
MKADPKGLIREAYRIEGIGPGECRSVFLDWALSVPADADHGALIVELLAVYGAGHPGHPMTQTLRAGLTPAETPRRRGGRKGRTG